jgi:hypothetical protein
VGYTDTEANVLQAYFRDHLPKAIQTAADLRNSGDDRYVWTVPAWLLYRYLRQAGPDERRRAGQAIQAGDIAWHALPFTWYTELLDRSSIAASLGFSGWLDERFGKRTTAARMTDVPGHTRGLVGPLADAGVTFLDIGVNPGCRAPQVPFVPGVGLPASSADEPDPDLVKWNEDEPVHADHGTPVDELRRLATEGMNSPRTHLFRWREESGSEITVLYHPTAYGSTVRIPGLPLAVSMRVHGDNLGPHSVASIRHSYATLRRKFPNAVVEASDLTTIGEAVSASPVELPVETREIGDSWIYGTGSDPAKTAGLREVLRLRSEWLDAGDLVAGSSDDLDLLEQLIPAPEHNWGLSTSVHLRCPSGYRTDELADFRRRDPRFQNNDREWLAKRQRPAEAIEVLPERLRVVARERLDTLRPAAPERGDAAETAGTLANDLVGIELSPDTGSLRSVVDRRTGREWAGPQGWGRFGYTGYDPADYARFSEAYNYSAFTANDFGKPGLSEYGAQHVELAPGGVRSWRSEDGLYAELLPPSDPSPDAALLTAWPRRVLLRYRLSPVGSAIEVDCWIVDKPANRSPEALWLSFDTAATHDAGWRLEKVGQWIDPREVVDSGGRRLHGIGRGVAYRDGTGEIALDSLDAHLVSPGSKGLLRFDNEPINASDGIHFALYNNLWGTAFPQWYDTDMHFRFRIALGVPGSDLV